MLKRHKTERTKKQQSARLLIVDDNADAGRILRKLLTANGYDVAEVADHQDALATLSDVSVPVAGVLASYTTAGTSAGLRLLDAIRNHSEAHVNALRVLVVSDNPRQQLFALEAGADELIVRPYHTRELLHAVQAMVERPESDRVESRRVLINKIGSAPLTGPAAVGDVGPAVIVDF